VTQKDECIYLLQTYTSLDYRLQTNIRDRITRVLIARGLLTSSEINKIKNCMDQSPETIVDFAKLTKSLAAEGFNL